MIRESRIRHGASELNVATVGDSDTVLLMFHGVTRRWQTFLPLIPDLALRYRVLLPDFRGHGRSDRRPREYRVTDYVRDAVDILGQIGHRNVLLYGHSLGAMVAAAVASEVPDRVRGVVMEDPPLHTMGQRIRETALHGYFVQMQQVCRHPGTMDDRVRTFGNIVLTDPATGATQRLADMRDATSLRFSVACLERLDPEVLEPIADTTWLDGYEVDAVFSGLRCPALLLQADTDVGGMLTDSDARHACRLSPSMSHVRLAGVGHVIHWARTRELLNLVHGFLESLG